MVIRWFHIVANSFLRFWKCTLFAADVFRASTLYITSRVTFNNLRGSEMSDSCSERATLLSRGGTTIQDSVDEAMKVRDESRILTGAFGWHCLALLGRTASGELSQDECLRTIRKVFGLGYVAKKEKNDLHLQDIASSDSIGYLNDEFDNDQMEFCLRLSLVMEEDMLRNEPSVFLSRHRVAEDILKALSQTLMEINIVTDEFLSKHRISKDIQGEFASKCASAYVLGYVAAKHPKRFETVISFTENQGFPLPPPPPPAATCPSCAGQLAYIQQYQRFYCYKCKKYA
jgi:hypothetical protein